LIYILRFLLGILWFVDSITFISTYKVIRTKRFVGIAFILFVTVIGVKTISIFNQNTLSRNDNLNPDETYVATDIQVEEYKEIFEDLEDTAEEGSPKNEEDKSVFEEVTNNSQKISDSSSFPLVSARSVLVQDLKKDVTIYEKNSELILPPASTSKMMTAIIALDKYNLEEEISVSYECSTLDVTKAGFPMGTTYKVKDLITATLVSSSGDAACALAEGVKIDEEGNFIIDSEFSNDFIFDMNQKTKQIGMDKTFYVNAIGLDGVASSHYSTAHDLYILASYLLNDPLLSDIVKTKVYTIESTNSDFSYVGTNTNILLWEVEGTIGVKTGTTRGAGEVLVFAYSKDDTELVVIVMQSEDRFGDVRAILEWYFE
jgi:D-alanyl-D-alanine carboxypeptidase (penicillin-binding protein 5/6)